MRAMILAAGLGERMRPLTANTPKPLLKVGDKSLIEHQIEKLVRGGITGMVVNHFYLGGMIEQALGDGKRYRTHIRYSREPIRLETAGGIIKALPALQDDCFVVVNADIWTDYDFARLTPIDGDTCLAHLVLVPNAEHNPEGDFCVDAEGKVHAQSKDGAPMLTFAGISVMHRKLFQGYPIQPRSVVPLLKEAMSKGLVTGEVYEGVWIDVGTPERLQEVIALETGAQSDAASKGASRSGESGEP